MKTPKPWFDLKYGWLQRKIPKQCVQDCARQGDCVDPCEDWVKRLPGFEDSIAAVRERAEKWIQEYGAWEREEIKAFSDFDLAVRVLWIATGDIKENGEWFGLAH